METIKVNMNPNPLDVQTIHASQNDGEARQWEFELHNNGELIDTSEITEQLFFKAYKGGTEQILPENTSTPTTSPFIGDIRYPQGLLTDQEFTYRQSPTEEDGLAKITDIKGNTLNWNQLVGTNVNGLSTIQGTTFSLNSNGSIHVTGTGTGNHFCEWRTNENPSFVMVKGHKYLATFKGLTNGINAQVGVYTTATTYLINKTNLVGSYAEIVTPTQDGITGSLVRFYVTNTFSGTTDITMQLFDLTQMGLDISNPSDFTSLFPLPYYAYNQGTLLSFNGNGIKTVGKNLFDFSQFANGTITFENGVLTGTAGQFYTAYDNTVNNGIELKYPKNTQITISFDARTEQNDSPTGGGLYFTASENGTRIQLATTLNTISSIQHKTVTIPSSRHIDKLGWTYGSNPNNIWHITNFQVEFETETSYEPYTTQTTNLPIVTYFPTGMKSAGDVYDELTETKAITRVGSVDLGTLSWNRMAISEGYAFVSSQIGDMVQVGNANTANVLCPSYTLYMSGTGYSMPNDKTYRVGGTYFGRQRVIIRDDSYTDATAFKSAMSGVYLYYELANPTETSFTTASLVTENGEVALANENGVLVGKCNSDVSADAGFIEGKIKLSDEDGDVYSNKIQIHVERKP